MSLLLFVLVAIVCPLAGCTAAADDAAAQIKEGIRLNDAQRFDEAIAIYRRVLADDPSNLLALYEIAHSMIAKGDPAGAIPWLDRALALNPANSNEFYHLLGIAREATGDLAGGGEAFRLAVAKAGERGALHFSLGVNLMRQEKFDEAVKAFEGNLLRRPEHGVGWLALADALARAGRTARALAATARALTLEPDTDTSRRAAALLWPLLFRGVVRVQEAGQPPFQIQVTNDLLDPDNLFMALVAAQRYTEPWAGKPDAMFFAWALDFELAQLSKKAKPDSHALWGSHVFAYFDGARQAGHMGALAYDLRRSLGDADTLRWLREHGDAVARYRAWSKQWTPPPLLDLPAKR